MTRSWNKTGNEPCKVSIPCYPIWSAALYISAPVIGRVHPKFLGIMRRWQIISAVISNEGRLRNLLPKYEISPHSSSKWQKYMNFYLSHKQCFIKICHWQRSRRIYPLNPRCFDCAQHDNFKNSVPLLGGSQFISSTPLQYPLKATPVFQLQHVPLPQFCTIWVHCGYRVPDQIWQPYLCRFVLHQW